MKWRGGRLAVLACCTPSTWTGSVFACSHCLAASSPRQAAETWEQLRCGFVVRRVHLLGDQLVRICILSVHSRR